MPIGLEANLSDIERDMLLLANADVNDSRSEMLFARPCGIGSRRCEEVKSIDGCCGFGILCGYPMSWLTRDRMLAMAALGLSIVAYAHPGDVEARRLSRVWERVRAVTYFDRMLNFSSSKGLRERSFEQIATEIKGASDAG